MSRIALKILNDGPIFLNIPLSIKNERKKEGKKER
jgi:hypothetical protein